MPDFGIGETIAALSAFGAGDAAVGAGAGIADAAVGAGLGADAAVGAGTSLADIVGTGTGLFAGDTGLAGTALASGAATGTDVGALVGAGATGLGSLGTAADFLAAPGASALGSGAPLTGGIESGALGSGAGASGANAALATFQPTALGSVTSSSLPPSVANANAGASVFDTGTAGVPGVSGTGAPSAIPPGAGASSLAAPPGVTAPLGVDPTAAATGTASAAPAAAPSSSIDSLLGKAGTGMVNSVTNNPLGIALGAAGLGYNILSGQKQTANQNALAADAKTATANSDKMVASGEALQKYLTDGTLPPNYQAQVDQAIQDAKTTAISNAAGQGLPTDPTKNTALAATLAKIDASRPAMQAQVAQTLFSSGSSLVSAGQSAAGLSGQLYQTLVQNDTTQAANTGKAIATLAAALNGKSQNSGPGNITVSTG
jgi:hypothetical protein